MTNLFLDMDDTLINARRAFCGAYNYYYQNHEDYKFADWKLNNEWDFTDVCPLIDGKAEVHDIFEDEHFFLHADFYDKWMEHTLIKLNQWYNIIICTIGTPKNIALKTKWLSEKVPFITNMIFISNKDCRMDKSIVNMKGGIIVDDSMKNLNSSNADTKICFGDKLHWNHDWNGIRAYNSLDLLHELLEG